jgi:hypothetical protein
MERRPSGSISSEKALVTTEMWLMRDEVTRASMAAKRDAIGWRHEFYGFAETIAFARLSAGRRS